MTSASAQKHSFQAEVKQVLDIVIHSLYTNREIFIRELISNAADALEKIRHEKVINPNIHDPDLPLEIKIEVDEVGNTITITDAGIGMTEHELIENLGTIAHSGTKEFLKHVKETVAKNVELIGQFGVGFYSSFMVANEVRVLSRSFQPDAAGMEWVSDGNGEYTLSTVNDLPRGTRIIIKLRDDAKEFAQKDTIKRIIKQYSNFVPFPIFLNMEKVNTIQAIWTRNKSEIKDEEYTEFYKFIANAYDEPHFRLHFTADAPLQISALLFTPKDNFEKFGFGRMDPGVNLYCRKVLIQQHSDAILPEWLRFVKGVVDSEDLPLNISRETLQDNALVRKLKKVITTRFLKFLDEQAKADPEKYSEFWKTFGLMLKEGVSMDFEYRGDIAPLLRYESSQTEEGKFVSLKEYVERMKPDQKSIYYLNGPNREAIQNGPYMEAFKKNGIEVLFMFEPYDDFVLAALGEFEGKKIVSADSAELDLPETKKDETEKETTEQPKTLSRDDIDLLTGWFKSVLGDRIDAVRDSKRLVDSPAIIVNTDAGLTTHMQKIMQAMNKDFAQIGKKSMEINAKHPLILQLAKLHNEGTHEDFLRLSVEQIYDNALVNAGLLADPRTMVERNYKILERALGV
ncbi:MAG: molecular chaperone HtpG [Candidatus Omnitrophota bacterium]|jgi:molecular chaperone HtpG|nr:MAG: molecular chaperone HtpG [Candidatus Omnitrophota bacterium]